MQRVKTRSGGKPAFLTARLRSCDTPFWLKACPRVYSFKFVELGVRKAGLPPLLLKAQP